MTTLKNYIPHLDGIRGLSILIVAISHGGFGNIIPGAFGVTVFFFISGYLITSLLLKEKLETNHIALTHFYMRRLWRLFPAMLAYTIVSLLLLLIFNHNFNLIEPATAIFYLSNYYKLFVGYTPIHHLYSPFDILWSLAVEEHFYLLFAPLMVWMAGRKMAITAILAMLVLPLAIRYGVTEWSTSAHFSDEYTYRSTECRLDSIAWGCLLALIEWKKFSKSHDVAFFTFGVLLLLSSFIIRDDYFRQTIRYSIQGFGLFLIIGTINCSNQFEFLRNQLSKDWIVYIGKLSYSIYLYHWLALILAEIYFLKIEISPMWQALYWTLTMSLSMASYYFIERPCLGLRRKYGSNV